MHGVPAGTERRMPGLLLGVFVTLVMRFGSWMMSTLTSLPRHLWSMEQWEYLVRRFISVLIAQARADNRKLIHSLTSHFRLINALDTRAADLRLPSEEEHSAYRFHKDMFLSGIEVIVVSALPLPT